MRCPSDTHTHTCTHTWALTFNLSIYHKNASNVLIPLKTNPVRFFLHFSGKKSQIWAVSVHVDTCLTLPCPPAVPHRRRGALMGCLQTPVSLFIRQLWWLSSSAPAYHEGVGTVCVCAGEGGTLRRTEGEKHLKEKREI